MLPQGRAWPTLDERPRHQRRHVGAWNPDRARRSCLLRVFRRQGLFGKWVPRADRPRPRRVRTGLLGAGAVHRFRINPRSAASSSTNRANIQAAGELTAAQNAKIDRKASRESVSLDDSERPAVSSFFIGSFLYRWRRDRPACMAGFHIGGSGLVGLVLLSSSVAGLVLAPVAGHLVDRHDRAKN